MSYDTPFVFNSDNKDKPVFFSDLDLTLIYSRHQFQKNGLTTAGSLVVEEYEELPLSFISLEAWELLRRHAGITFNFVPTTTRTLAQYSRINFPHVPIKAAIVLNGAQILIDGKLDEKWNETVAQGLKEQTYQPAEVFDLVTRRLEGHKEVRLLRMADETFVYIVAHTPDCPEIDAFTVELAERTGYTRSKQGRKTYLVPSNVSKGSAVRELKHRFRSTASFAAGDSNLDFTMIPEVDYFLNPKHGDVPPALNNVQRTEKESVFSAEEIVQFISYNSMKFM
jgi:hydroxymethylpyrimidine pyrophosphatase-like HAD family hydrolase